MKDYYAVLQIPDNATRPDIQAAYRRLAKQYHPDVNKSENANEKFCEITEAYEFLMSSWTAQYTPSHDFRDRKYAGYYETEEYRKFRQEVRERAQKQAKMRYEKFKQQHEAFRTSGIYDLGILLKMVFRMAGVLVFFFFLLTPVFLMFRFNWMLILSILICWPLAGLIGRHIYKNRKSYFIPGKLYYSPDRIRHLFTDTHPAVQECYYCPEKPADSVPYKLELFKMKDVKLSTGGFRQHNVHYVNKTTSTLIPRSQKALILHSASSMIKMTALLLCMIFLPWYSMVWRFIAGLAAGGIISTMLLTATNTRSNVSYLISYGMICRICIWLVAIALVSRIQVNPLNISTSDSIQFVVTAIFLFDCLIMQFLEFMMGKYAVKPVVVQYPEVVRKMDSGYHVYNDIPFISVAYPMLKWLFG